MSKYEISHILIDPIRQAAMSGVFSGVVSPWSQLYIERCTWWHPNSGTMVIYTRDTGHHSSGWMKNPDFERCLHLSLSFREPMPAWPAERLVMIRTVKALGMGAPPVAYNRALAEAWARCILRGGERLAWIESAKTPEGIANGVMHYRVFCDERWLPISPRGEVYSTRNTPADWKSWTEVHGDGAPNPSIIDPS